ELGNRPSVPGILNSIADVHLARSNFAQALAFYQKSLALADAFGLKTQVVNALVGIGTVHTFQQNYEEALGFYQKSLKLEEELGSRAALARILDYLANVYHLQGKQDQALEMAGRAAGLAAGVGAYDYLWGAHLVSGMAYRALKQPANARQALERAIGVV